MSCLAEAVMSLAYEYESKERDIRARTPPRRLIGARDVVVGFVGSRIQLTPTQRDEITNILRALDVAEVRHGDCFGADAEFHDIATTLGLSIVVHPPVNRTLRVHKTETTLRPKPYARRNRDIVDAIDVLIACPKESEEQPLSGVWAAVQYARKRGKKVQLITP